MLRRDLKEPWTAELAAEIAARLDRGEVGILPTETVYGLCCSAAHAASVARVYALKQRPPSMALPLVFGGAAQALAWTRTKSLVAHKLQREFWPGPLTLVLGQEPGQAIRVPRHGFTQAVLDIATGPIHATSVNVSGSAAGVREAELQREIVAATDFLVADDTSVGGTESTIVRVSEDGRAIVLRAGAISAKSVEECLRYRIVLLCTGNTCRSPMAEVLLRHMLCSAVGYRGQGDPPGFRIHSGGVAASGGQPASENAIAVMAARGLDLGSHHSTPAAHLLGDADLVLCMTEEHLRFASGADELSPYAQVQLLDPNGLAVSDPFGGSLRDYEDCVDQLHQSLASRIAPLQARRPN